MEQLEGTVNFPGGIRKLHKGHQELRPYVESFHIQRPQTEREPRSPLIVSISQKKLDEVTVADDP